MKNPQLFKKNINRQLNSLLFIKLQTLKWNLQSTLSPSLLTSLKVWLPKPSMWRKPYGVPALLNKIITWNVVSGRKVIKSQNASGSYEEKTNTKCYCDFFTISAYSFFQRSQNVDKFAFLPYFFIFFSYKRRFWRTF